MEQTPKIVGIVNITEDSFSDGGQFLAANAAVDHARKLSTAGADYLELGPASSRPDAAHVSSDVQIERIASVLAGLTTCETPISIDATDAEVIRFSIGAGVSMLNDVRGFSDRRLHSDLAGCKASLVVVHSLLELERAVRSEATPEQVLASIDRFFERRLTELTKAGVSEDRLIVDPGMGFFLGSDPYASISVLQRIPELRARFGRPIFISVSRKSFLRALTGRPVDQIGPATLAAELYAACQGADYLRSHDVGALHDALAVSRALSTKLSTDS